MVEGADFFERFADFLERACFCAVTEGEDESYFTAVGDSEILFHLVLVIHTDNAGVDAERKRFMAHIHTCRTEIALCETLGIFVMGDDARHNFGGLFNENHKSRNIVPPRSSGYSVAYDYCIAEL